MPKLTDEHLIQLNEQCVLYGEAKEALQAAYALGWKARGKRAVYVNACWQSPVVLSKEDEE